MQFITSTDLRTKSSELIKTLKKGGSVSLVHRSQVIGEIKPKKEAKVMTASDIAKLKQIAKKMNLPKTSYKQREKNYRKHIMEKYGKGLS